MSNLVARQSQQELKAFAFNREKPIVTPSPITKYVCKDCHKPLTKQPCGVEHGLGHWPCACGCKKAKRA